MANTNGHASQANVFLRLPEVRRRAGLGRTSLYELIGRGEFPRPYPLSETGRAVAWLEAEVDGWICSRVAAARRKD